MDKTFNSDKYWEDRYINGGDSGAGSRGIFAEYKSDFINKFILDKNIKSINELGCGDLLFTLINVDKYTGYDVSDYIIRKNREISNYDFTSSINELDLSDLTLSMDVILHLIDDDIYMKHMFDLFRLSTKYVIIYSTDWNEILGGAHNKFRDFKSDVSSDFYLVEHIKNPHKNENSLADFFIYERK